MSVDKEKLAIFGGDPVRKELLPYGKQSIDEDDIKSVVDVLRSDFITTGPKVEEFEKCFADFVGSKYAVSFSSGTAALHGSIFAANIKDGDEVITTPLTFCATANCVLFQRAKPVFADVTPDNLNIDPQQILKKITKKTRAIIPVDYAGHPADLDYIMDIADSYKLMVIEDACHAVGAEYNGKMVGSISHMTVFSFHPVKQITTGEGGMVTTNNHEFAEKLKIFRNHCIKTKYKEREKKGTWFYEVLDLGYNYRLTDIQCALGISQLKKLPEFLERRKEIARKYDDYFKEQKFISPLDVKENVSHAFHLYVIKLNLESFKVGKDELFNALRAEGIGINVHYIPIYNHPFYRTEFPEYTDSCPKAEKAYGEILSLPIFPDMNDKDVDDVVTAVKKVLSTYES